MDTATANPEYYFKRGYSSFDVGNIMRIVAMLDKSTQARVFERTRRDIDEEEKKLIRLGRTRSPQV
jgi:hypothetical protein